MECLEKKRILVIEDDEHIAEGLKLNLMIEKYQVMIASDGVAGLAQWKAWKPDLIVLDIMLPRIDGLSLLQSIRLEDEQIPILILSAKNAFEDKIKGLKYGVDDYLAKPFNLKEFLLRISRLLTRASWSQKKSSANDNAHTVSVPNYAFGGNLIDFKASLAHCKLGTISLTGQEVKLLKLFIANRGKSLSRARLLEIGWGYSRDITTRTVDNFIVRFRKYFEDNPKKPAFFKSIRSIGYVFEDEKKTD